MNEKRLLIVDDDLSLRASMRLILKHRGYDVSLACGGSEAIELIREKDFPLILMDIRMPGMSGLEVFEQLKKEGVFSKVVFISAYAVDDDLVRALDAGAVEVLRKPVDIDRLLMLVDEHCDPELRTMA